MAHVDRSEVCKTSPLVSVSYASPLPSPASLALTRTLQARKRWDIPNRRGHERYRACAHPSSLGGRRDHVGPLQKSVPWRPSDSGGHTARSSEGGW